MNVSLLLLPGFLLLLVFSVCDRLVGANKQEAVVSPEDHGIRLQSLWKLHMRDTLLKGKGEQVPGKLFFFFCGQIKDTNIIRHSS